MNNIWNPAELETVPCDQCGGTETTPLIVRPDGMRVVRCQRCQLAYLNPRPRAEFVQRLYDADYFNKAVGGSGIGYADYGTLENRAVMVKISKLRLAVLEGLWAPTGQRCLEIGCATGEFCGVLARQGATVTGTDLSEHVLQTARQRYPDVDFRVGSIDRADLGAGYDAVFGFELIEHVLSPRQFLRHARQRLKPGGLLVLTTPNLTCAEHATPERWIGFLTSFEHLYFYHAATLTALAGAEGFEAVATFTGLGDGLQHPPPASRTWRDWVALGLRRLGVFGWLRLKRNEWRRIPNTEYRPGGHDHNLFAVYRSRAPA